MKTTTHITAIDSLRFIAATAVVIAHCGAIFGETFIGRFLPRGLLNSKSAVSFFFVLSGFVLYLSIKDFSPTVKNYVAFSIRRVFRLYPLFHISLLVSLAVILLLPLTDTPSLMADQDVRYTLEKDHGDISQILMQFTLILPMVDTAFLNPPMWTLAAEMRIALIFPVLALPIHFLRPGFAVFGFILLVIAAPLLAKVTIPTVNIIPLFYLGALLAKLILDKKVNSRWAGFVFLVSLLVYMSPIWIGREKLGAVGHFYLAGLGSAGLIYGTVFSRFLSEKLSSKPLAVLGSYSYGIYIIHGPVIFAVAYWTRNLKLGGLGAFALVLMITLSLSAFFHHFIETKFIKIGRQLAAFVNQPKAKASSDGKAAEPAL